MTAPLACFRCGYQLDGLDLRRRCPECATPISHSHFERAARFPSQRRLRTSRMALLALEFCAIAAPIAIPFSIAAFIFLPWYGLDYTGDVVLTVGWFFWNAAWWRLAAADPTTISGHRLPPENQAMQWLACLIVCFTAAFLMLFFAPTWFIVGPGVDYPPLARLTPVLPLVLPFLQIWISTRLLARFVSPPRRNADKPGDLPALRWCALVTATLISATAAAAHLSPLGWEFRTLAWYAAFAAIGGAASTTCLLVIALHRAHRACRFALRNPPAAIP